MEREKVVHIKSAFVIDAIDRHSKDMPVENVIKRQLLNGLIEQIYKNFDKTPMTFKEERTENGDYQNIMEVILIDKEELGRLRNIENDMLRLQLNEKWKTE